MAARLTGWPYQATTFTPQLTTNKLTRANIQERVPELAAQIIQERTLNQAVSDIRLGEEAAAAEARADLAPVQKAVESLGIQQGLIASVDPAVLGEAYKKAIEAAARDGKTVDVWREVAADIEARISSGELAQSKVDNVYKKIEEATGPGGPPPGILVGKTPDIIINETTGDVLDATGAKIGTITSTTRETRIKIGTNEVSFKKGDFRRLFNPSGRVDEFGVKEDALERANALYAMAGKAEPFDLGVDRMLERNVGKAYKDAAVATDLDTLMGTTFASVSPRGDISLDVDAPADKFNLSLETPTGPKVYSISGTAKTIKIMDGKRVVATMPKKTFAAWMELSETATLEPYNAPGRDDIREKMIKSNLAPLIPGPAKNRNATPYDNIKKVYADAGLTPADAPIYAELERVVGGPALYGHGKKMGGQATKRQPSRTFRQETAALSKKLFNEISSLLDQLEASGQISAKQREKVLARAMKDLAQ
jgi:hypothetical protein